MVVGVPSHYRLIAQLLTAPLPEAVYICSGGPLDPALAEEFHRRAGRPGAAGLRLDGNRRASRRGSGRAPGGRFLPWRWRVRESDARLLIESVLAGPSRGMACDRRGGGGRRRHVQVGGTVGLRGQDRRPPVLDRRGGADGAGRCRRSNRPTPSSTPASANRPWRCSSSRATARPSRRRRSGPRSQPRSPLQAAAHDPGATGPADARHRQGGRRRTAAPGDIVARRPDARVRLQNACRLRWPWNALCESSATARSNTELLNVSL